MRRINQRIKRLIPITLLIGIFTTEAVNANMNRVEPITSLNGIKGWAKSTPVVKKEDKNDVTYHIDKDTLTIFWGKKPSGGYDIKIREIKRVSSNVEGYDELFVTYETKKPAPGMVVTESMIYPKDSSLIPKSNKKIKNVHLIERKENQYDSAPVFPINTGEDVSFLVQKNLVTISWGAKPNLGFRIFITDVKRIPSKTEGYEDILVSYKTQAPKPGEIHPHMIVYPQDTSIIPLSIKPIKRIILEDVSDSRTETPSFPVTRPMPYNTGVVPPWLGSPVPVSSMVKQKLLSKPVNEILEQYEKQ